MEAQIDLLPKQTEAWEAWESPEITELGYGGAAGGGKTRLGWYLMITICEQYPGAQCVVGRKELKTLRMTTLKELWIIFGELKYQKDIDYRFDAKDNVIHFPNGSQVTLLDTAYSPEDPEYTRFGSLPVSVGWIDESNETPEKAKAILKTRVGRANIFTIDGKKVLLKGFWLETFNPNKGHVYRDYYKPWKNGTLPPYRMFIRALPGDNPHLPQTYIENLKRSDKVTQERLLKGNFEFDADPQKIFDYAAITDLPENTLINNKSTKMLIADIARFGGDKIVLGTFRGMELYRLGVYTYQGTDTTAEKMRDEIIDQNIAYANVLADEDGIGGGVVDQMTGIKGFSGNATPLQIWDFVLNMMRAANFANFRSQCYFMLSEAVNNHAMSIKIEHFDTNIEGYTVEQALSDLFEEIDAIKSKENSEDRKLAIIPKSEIKEALGRSPDFADIMMMRMYYEIKEHAIEPPRQGPRQVTVRKNQAR